jgi:hypothetical protein
MQNSETAPLEALQSGSQMCFEIRPFLVRQQQIFLKFSTNDSILISKIVVRMYIILSVETTTNSFMVCCAATNWPSLCSLSPRLST